MVSETALQSIEASLAQVTQYLDDVYWAVVEAQPAGEGHALVDVYDSIVSDAIGAAQGARAALESLGQEVRGRGSPERAAQALAECHEQCNQLARLFYGELVSLERVAGLASLADERGGAWAVWTRGVRDSLGRCPEPLDTLARALPACWRELATHNTGAPLAHAGAGSPKFADTSQRAR